MRRRSFLAGAVAGATALPGCTDATFTFGDPAVTERELPNRPDSLTARTVVDYVAEYEAARVHNAHAGDDVTEVNVSTEAVLDYETANGYHVTVQYAGSVSHEQNGAESVGELYSEPIPYRVSANATRRAALTTDAFEEPFGTAGDEVDRPLGIRLPNFDGTDHELSVTVDTDAGDGNRILERTVDVGAESAIEIREIAVAPDTYRITATLSGDGPTARARIDVPLADTERIPAVDLAVTPADGLTMAHLPEADLMSGTHD